MYNSTDSPLCCSRIEVTNERGDISLSGWGKDLAQIWTNNVAPSRPSCAEMCVYTKYLRQIQNNVDRPIKLLVLGSTPEFRDWGYEENLSISVVDKSKEYYKEVTREIRHKNLKENLYVSSWEDMGFDDTFDIIIGDLSIGNIDPSKFEQFLLNISNTLSDEGFFLGKSFIWSPSERCKTPKQIIDEYRKSIHIHPYTFINHQLGFYCLDRVNYSIDFRKMFKELTSLHNTGYIDDELYSYFTNVGWNTEMKFTFFAPSQEQFVSDVNKYLEFVKFEHTTDEYTTLFPIYVIKKRR